jgi:hypothetical protein
MNEVTYDEVCFREWLRAGSSSRRRFSIWSSSIAEDSIIESKIG